MAEEREFQEGPSLGEEISDLSKQVKDYAKEITKSVREEAALANLSMVLRPAYTAANNISQPEYVRKVTSGVNLQKFRAALIPVMPFWQWARDLFRDLPGYEARILMEEPAIPMRDLMDRIAGQIHQEQVNRDRLQRMWIDADKDLRKDTAKLMRFLERGKKEEY